MDDLIQQLENRVRKLCEERDDFEHKQAQLRRINKTIQAQHTEAINQIETLLIRLKSIESAQS